MLKSAAGIDVQHIPYKGGAPAIVDMLGGRINFMMLNPLGLRTPDLAGVPERQLAMLSHRR